MRLEEILRALARLTAEERQQLRAYLDRLSEKLPRLSPDERMQHLSAAFDEMGEGLSPAEPQETVAAMTTDGRIVSLALPCLNALRPSHLSTCPLLLVVSDSGTPTISRSTSDAACQLRTRHEANRAWR